MQNKPSYEELEIRVQRLEKALAEKETVSNELEKDRTWFKSLYEKAPLGYQSLDRNGNFLEVNKAWLDLLGYSREEVIGKSFGDFLHPEWRDHFKKNFPRFKAVGEVLGVEFEIARKDGTYILVSFNGKIGKNIEGDFLQTHCIFRNITEEKKVEEQLKSSEERYRLLFDESINPIAIYNQSAEFVMINQIGADNLSLPVNEIIGKPLSHFLPEMHDLTVRRIAETLEGNKGLHFEDEILINGQKRNFLSIFQPVHGLTHDSDTVQVVSYDITKRKQAEKALLEYEQRWQNILVNTPQIGISIDLQGKIIFVNKHFLELTGWNEEDVLGQDWFNMFIPEDIREEIREVFQTTIQDIDTLDFASYENDIVTRSGDMRSIAWSNVLSRNTEGEILDVTCLGIDLTERNQTADALAKQKNLFETMFNTIPDGVVVTNTKREIQLANKGMASTFGYNPEELLGKSTEILYACDKRFDHTGLTVFEKKASKKEDLYVTSYKDNSGKEFPGETFGAKLFDGKGQWLGNLGIMRDISERIQREEERLMLQKQLQQSQKMEAIGTLAGGIAHDFNNILGAIIGYAEMIQEDCSAESTTAHDIKQVITAGNRAKELVKQILAFSRQMETEKIPIQPAIIVKEVIKLLRSSMPATISIEQNINQNVGVISADPNQIYQVVMNICTNAFHAMEVKGGCLTITLQNKVHFDENYSNPGTFVQLSISDTGEGIKPDELERIFDPYFTTKEVGKGTGMGLSIAHGIVQSYGGSIVCKSRLGEGSVFHVSLPALEDHSLQESKSVEETKGGKEYILFVDDEKMLLQLGGTMLKRLGYNVTTIGNSAEALAAFENEPNKFDLVISDQTMPGMTGIDLSRRMLQIRPGLPIILCTGFSNQISEEKARKYGIKGFAMKPLAKKDLATLIRKVLDGEKREG